MLITSPHKFNQFFVVLIKLCLVVGAFYFVYHKLTTNDELELHSFLDILFQNDLLSVPNMFLLMILTGLNWSFEILKWKTLVSSVISIPYKNAVEQSLGGLTVSMLTPNRIGDYGAKAIYYQKPFRKKILLLNLISNMLQMGTTLFFGTLGLLYFTYLFSVDLDRFNISMFFLIFILISSAVIYLLRKNQIKIKGFPFLKIKHFIQSLSLKIILKACFFSVIRYLIFSFQFYILLHIFNVNITYLSAMTVITTMYLVSSIFPTVFIFDVVIKGSVAVYLFSMIGVDEMTILCIVSLMWLLNFVIPSMFGSYYVLNFSLPKAQAAL